MALRARQPNDDGLIERHITPDLLLPDRARLTDSGIPVWALVAYWQATDEDLVATATEYEVSVEEVTAALAYYERHRSVFDARMVLHHAAFA